MHCDGALIQGEVQTDRGRGKPHEEEDAGRGWLHATKEGDSARALAAPRGTTSSRTAGQPKSPPPGCFVIMGLLLILLTRMVSLDLIWSTLAVQSSPKAVCHRHPQAVLCL